MIDFLALRLKSICIGFLILANLYSAGQNIGEKEKPKPVTRILFLFDASQSMYGRWQSDMKINIAQKLLSNLLDSLKNQERLELGLRVYGHQKNFPPQDCDDTRLEIPLGKDNAGKIQHFLKTLIPRGTTPIATSLEKAATDFIPCADCRNIIVLITDGLEECGGDPCAVSRDLQKKGIILKPFIIGIGKNFKENFECVGTYFDASSEPAFRKALDVVISQALNSTTAQVNLLDSDGKPTETNVNMTFYNHMSGQVMHNFVHTLNNKGLPDTLVIDPLVTYDIVVQTIPPVRTDSIVLTPGKHTIVPVSCPQGMLNLKCSGLGKNVRNLDCIVRQKGSPVILHVQPFNTAEKYLTGRYDLEVLSLPRLAVDDVEISQSHTTTVEIPVPGMAVIQKTVDGYGSLYVEEKNKMRWIYNLNWSSQPETLMLQPGRYKVVFRSKYSTKAVFTVEESFIVEPGVTTTVKLYDN